jgi:hypothetical protein
VKSRTVALFESHLGMATIGARLRQKRGIRVRTIKGLPNDIDEKIRTSPPDAIIFDLAAAAPSFAVPLLRRFPGVVLIGVDLTTNRMLVMSGKQARLLTDDDLVRVIEQKIPSDRKETNPQGGEHEHP